MKAFVTGADRGIGRACAIALAADGYDIILCYCSRKDAAEETAREINNIGRKVWIFNADFSVPQNVKELCTSVKAECGIPDVIVNNAGVCYPAQIQDASDEDWDKCINTNLKAVFTICREFSEGLISRKSGSIVNIASIWGRTGAAVESVYCASKGAIVTFSKALAAELGPSGIRVNCVSPGVIDTEMNASYNNDERRELEERTPLGRMGKPEDVANAVAFLVSEKASFITGEDLLVDGGFLI